MAHQQDVLELAVGTLLFEPDQMLASVRCISRRMSWNGPLALEALRRASAEAVSRGHRIRALAICAELRNRTIDRLLFQLRAVWRWMVDYCSTAQVRAATVMLENNQAAMLAGLVIPEGDDDIPEGDDDMSDV